MASSSQQSSKWIWFELVDDKNRPLPNTSATSFLRAQLEEQNVDQFRQAVHKLYENDDLKDIAAAKLKVYKDQAALDANVPLKVNDPIAAEFGAKLETAMMVMVPVTRPDVPNFMADFLKDKSINLENCWTADTRCLTLDLQNRLTEYKLNQDDDVKVLLALSGAGKTRTLLELLYKKWGFYFVASAAPRLGSNDLSRCSRVSRRNSDNVESYVQLLLNIRNCIMKWFRDTCHDPAQWLYAQLYPEDVFGSDIFAECFTAACNANVLTQRYTLDDCLIAVDEIQEFLSDSTSANWLEFNNPRPFLSPLIYYMKPFSKHFILSGTGINFKVFQEIAGSHTLKQWQYKHEDINQLKFMDQKSVFDYTNQVMERRLGIMGRSYTRAYERVASALSENVLLHGRPRITASVLDNIFSRLGQNFSLADSVEFALSELWDFALGKHPEDCIVRFLREQDGADNIMMGEFTFKQVVCNMFIDSLLAGKGCLAFGVSRQAMKQEDAVEMVRRGVGYIHRRTKRDKTRGEVVLSEPIVKMFLSVCYPDGDLVESILQKIRAAPRNTHVGDWFEYLVAFALVKNLREESKKDEPITRYADTLENYLLDDRPDTFLKPDDRCGPDIIYKNGNTVWVVQVRCVKRFYRGYRLNSAQTVDPQRMYTVRDHKSLRFGLPLVGYETKRQNILEILNNGNFNIRKMVVASTRVKIPADISDIDWVSAKTKTGETFFSCFAESDTAQFIWEALDEQCNHEDFEVTNAQDFDDLQETNLE